MFEELKTFIAVVEYKNFTKAGEHLNLSQPSVSTHIKNLENNFGVTLINRSVKQKTIFITESGYTLYKRAKEIINLIDITSMEVLNTSDSIKGHIKIGASLTTGEYILPKFLAIFCEKYPDVDIEIFIENTSNICSDLKDLTLDIGFIEGVSSHSNFTQKCLMKDKMVLAFPYRDDFDKNSFSFEELQNRKWVIREDGSGSREFFNMFLGTNEIVPKNVIVLGSNYAVKEAVKNGLGIAIMSKFVASVAAQNKEVSIIELDDFYTHNFSYILPKNITISKATEVFLDEFILYTSELSK